MFRLLHAQAYRLRKSKNFYICMAVMAAFVLLMFGIFSLAESIQSGKVENGTGGIVFTPDHTKLEEGSASIWGQIGILDILQQVFSGDFAACILAIFVSIFVISEYGSGMIKNIVGKGSSRVMIFLSRLCMAVLGSVCIIAVGVLVTLAAGRFFLGADAFAGSFWYDFLVYTGLQILLVSALTAVYVLIGEICRNMAAGISLGIGVAALPVLLLNGLDFVCRDYGITPSDYWLVTRGESCPQGGFSAGYVAETVLVAVFWFVAAAGVGIWHFRKMDIK